MPKKGSSSKKEVVKVMNFVSDLHIFLCMFKNYVVFKDSDGDVKGPVTKTKDGHISISIQVKPGAKSNAVNGKN